MPGKVKAYELQSKCVSWRVVGRRYETILHCMYRSKNDLNKQLQELKQELLQLRVQRIAGGSASKLTKMCVQMR